MLSWVVWAVLAYWACFFIRDALAQFASIDWSKAGGTDAAVDWKAARLFWRGLSPYTPDGLKAVGVKAFGHPPSTPFWFLPLAELDHATFAQVVGLVNIGLTIGLIGIVVFTLGWPFPWVLTGLLFGIVQSLPPALEHARVIQVSVWIGFAYVLAWRWLRSGRDAAAGVVLGLACTLKFFPGLMVVYLVVCRRWRAVAASVASFGVVASVMTWRFGLESWPLFFKQQGYIASKWLTTIRNASLHGIIRRAFVGQCEPAPLDDGYATACIFLITVAALALAGAAWYRARSRQPALAVFDRSFALFSMLSAFLNPWVWEHYFYILLLPAMLGWHSVLADVARVWNGWLDGRRSPTELVLPTAGALLSLVPTYTAFLGLEHLFRTNNDAITAACGPMPNREVQHWMLVESRYIEVVNWLPWVAFVVLFLALLTYRTPAPPHASEP